MKKGGTDECVQFLVALVVLLTLSLSVESRPKFRTMHKGKLECLPSSSVWIRNSCHDGFIHISPHGKHHRVLSQHDGLSKFSPQVELVKESCTSSSISEDEDSFFHQSIIKTRLYSPTTKKYICFNKRGKIVSKSSKSVRRMGDLCTFVEHLSDKNEIRYSSGSNPKWYLGFDGKHPKRSRYNGNPVTLPVKMRRRRRVRKNKCDFNFKIGEFQTSDIRDEYSGLIKHIQLQIEQDEKVKDNHLIVKNTMKNKHYKYFIQNNDERYKENNEIGVDEDEHFDFKQKLKYYKLKRRKRKKQEAALIKSKLSSSKQTNKFKRTYKKKKRRPRPLIPKS